MQQETRTMKRTRKNKVAGVLGVLAAALSLGAQVVSAAPVTFAQFTQRGADNLFFFTNLTTSAQIYVPSDGVPVDFFFSNITGLPAELGTNQAHLFWTAATTNHVFAGPGNTLFQPFQSPGPNKMIIIRDTPASFGNGGRTNLLTIEYTGIIFGQKGANSTTGNASTGAGNLVTLTSDFLDFSGTFTRDMSVSFTSLLPSLDTNGFFLLSFSAAGTGTFSSEPAPVIIPEPGSAALFVAGLLGFWPSRRRRVSYGAEIHSGANAAGALS
ncbi:MAG: PEP-CTERM sorting domain-containing protein [Verrucomicrobiae bacterium]|nr:PEP-CTERM sorting domain-containing protein [Verrucomicrobiae bacterium]